MAYFSKFPSINYPYNENEDIKQSVDVLKRIGIRENIKNDFAVWEKYTIVDGEKPESIAYKLYGSSIPLKSIEIREKLENLYTCSINKNIINIMTEEIDGHILSYST